MGWIGGYAEHSFTEIRQFSGNVGKIIDPVFHVCIEASVGLRHDDGQVQFFRVSLQGGVPLPYAVVVGAAVKQIENRRRFCIPVDVLVNFWLGTEPKTVFAFGDLNFYGKQNAEKRGVKNFYYRCHGSEAAKGDHFAIDIENNPVLKGLYLDAEADSGYIRDRSVFGDDISIEDTMAVLVRYKNNAMMSYSLNSYMPWEGFNVEFNGSKGRIEYHAVEKSYINAGGDKKDEGKPKLYEITVYPIIGEPYKVPIEHIEGGHGGGDPVMLEDLFHPGRQVDPFHRAADHVDGIKSILTGVAANKAIASGLPVNVADLVKF